MYFENLKLLINLQKIILYGIQAGILLSAQTLAAQGTQARRARLRRALTEAANSDTVPIIKTVQKNEKKNTHTFTHNNIICPHIHILNVYFKIIFTNIKQLTQIKKALLLLTFSFSDN